MGHDKSIRPHKDSYFRSLHVKNIILKGSVFCCFDEDRTRYPIVCLTM